MNEGNRGVSSLIAAITSAVAGLASGSASLTFNADVILGWITALMAGGFLFFVRRWMAEREENDRKVMDTLRIQNEKQAKFERDVSHFMGQVQGRLGLHRYDSDPEIHAPKEDPRGEIGG